MYDTKFDSQTVGNISPYKLLFPYPYKDHDKAFSQVAALNENGIPAVDRFAI